MLTLLAITAMCAQPAWIRDQVQTERIESDLRAMSGLEPLDDGTLLLSRSISNPQILDAEAWLIASFEAVEGLTVSVELVPGTSSPHALHNIIAELPGRDPSLPPMVLMAHYDSTASLDDGWDASTDPAPGADDDASGIAAILESARVLASWEPGFDRSIRFIGFTAEEVGLVGSFAHVDNLAGEPVHLALALDPVGHNPGDSDVLWFSYDARWVGEADALEALAEEVSELSVTGVDQDLFGGDERSDHFPFWEAELPALHIGTFPLPPSYHTTEDTLDQVDLHFLTEVVVLTASRASEESAPGELVAGCACDQPGPAGGVGVLAAALLTLMRRRRSTTG